MTAFSQAFTGLAAPLLTDNVDTDAIILSRELVVWALAGWGNRPNIAGVLSGLFPDLQSR